MKQNISRKGATLLPDITTLLAFCLPLTAYWLTVAPSVSFWDCPEYVAVGSRLEIGHPPGNPLWQLLARMIAITAPAGKESLWINLSSGLFTAAAMALSQRFLANMLMLCVPKKIRPWRRTVCSLCAFAATMTLAFSDSVWFSAVEAEVYALSLCLTSLSLWLMMRWWLLPAPMGPRGRRLLVLVAYVTGLSLGVHQLNLLVLPGLAVMYAYRRKPRRAAPYALRCMAAALCAVALVLGAMMPGVLTLAGHAELMAVNGCGLPRWSGALGYVGVTAIAMILALWLTDRSRTPRLLNFLLLSCTLFLSGIFLLGGNVAISLMLSAAVAAWCVWSGRVSRSAVREALWMLAMTLAGYSVYALIPVRSAASPPLNEGAPSDIFAFRSYLARDQYGSNPLFYGPTPFSRPLSEERWLPDSTADYSLLALRDLGPRLTPAVAGGRYCHRSRMMTHGDSIVNINAGKRDKGGYVVADHRYTTMTAPELNMWFPRITSGDPADLESYAAWAGMDTASMLKVEASEAIDSTGKFVAKIHPLSHRRIPRHTYRPTYLQNLRMLFGYQIGYMYLRYLMWNFSGRQNDIPSTGEADHGNFITGIPPLDDAMLGRQALLPPEAGSDNRGHNEYFMIPFLLGVAGMVFTAAGGRRPRRWGTVVLVLFLMTGMAIVVYLNQIPGEARERDYSFMGSFMAFSLWIGFGMMALCSLAAAIARNCRGRGAVAVGAACAMLALPVYMAAENADDHDRSRRSGATDLALNLLRSLPGDAILFTDGDNLTFPLWYARDVLGVRRDVAVVNIAYLSMPSYVEALKIPVGAGVKGIRMKATAADLLYGRYALTAIPAESDTIPLPILLDRLFSDDSPSPQLAARYASLTLPDGSVRVLDLRKASGGGGWMRLPVLATLDILASAGRERELHWVNGLPPHKTAGLSEWLVPSLFTRSLSALPADSLAGEALQRIGTPRSGGCDLSPAPYYDPGEAKLLRWQRASMALAGRRMLNAGHPRQAMAITRMAARLWPPHVVEPGFVSTGDTVFHDMQLLASVMEEAARATADTSGLHTADSLLLIERKRLAAWRRYYESLPRHMRSAVSADTRRKATHRL